MSGAIIPTSLMSMGLPPITVPSPEELRLSPVSPRTGLFLFKGLTMAITLTEIHHPDAFINRELRVMARHSRKFRLTTWYRVCWDGEEVAFLAIDRRPDRRLIPHLLVVPRDLRRRGIGSAVLREVERLAQDEGCDSVRVWPRPLDAAFDRRALESWYRKRGYQGAADGTGEMEKRLAAPALGQALAS
jgi:GNAT superfamily N-acetyltransferase